MILGTVHSLHIFPVKSMAGLSVDEVDVYWYGFNGDRKAAFVQSNFRSGFPWLTGREVAGLVRYQPYFVNYADMLTPRIRVKTPNGADFALASSELKAELEGAGNRPIHLMHLKRGTYDAMPISLVSRKTIASLGQLHGSVLDIDRFRMNIVVDVESEADTPEDEWLDHTIAFSSGSQVHFSHRAKRCAMITIDPETAQKDPTILRTVATKRNSCVGIYGNVVRVGKIRVGDQLRQILT